MISTRPVASSRLAFRPVRDAYPPPPSLPLSPSWGAYSVTPDHLLTFSPRSGRCYPPSFCCTYSLAAASSRYALLRQRSCHRFLRCERHCRRRGCALPEPDGRTTMDAGDQCRCPIVFAATALAGATAGPAAGRRHWRRRRVAAYAPIPAVHGREAVTIPSSPRLHSVDGAPPSPRPTRFGPPCRSR